MKYNSTEQTITWFLEISRDGNLTLNPPFQRRRVWTVKQKSNLIESVLLGLPIPEIYMQQKTSPEGRTDYVIVDGQQRTAAILEFADEEEGFELRNLSPHSLYRGLTFKDLTDDQKQAFFGHRLSVRILDNVTDEEVTDLFRRLNRYLTKLNPQELRNATYSGPFIRLAEELADDPYWAENRIVSAADIRRMVDIEYLSDLLIGVMNGPQGGSPGILDSFYDEYEQYERQIPQQGAVKRLFDRTLLLTQDVLPNIKITRRWGNKTDFYTLFVAVAHLLREQRLPETAYEALASTLKEFAEQIDARLGNQRAKVSRVAADYVRAVEKGSSDKARRAVRHQAMLEVISKHFVRRNGS